MILYTMTARKDRNTARIGVDRVIIWLYRSKISMTAKKKTTANTTESTNDHIVGSREAMNAVKRVKANKISAFAHSGMW